MKQIIDLRPVYHRLEERIRAHVILCWLALLLIRIIETTTGAHLAQASAANSSASTPGPSPAPPARSGRSPASPSPRRDLLAKLGIPHPKQVLDLQPAPR